jgi:hypothetical protein
MAVLVTSNQRHEYGSHSQAIHDAQVAASQQIFTGSLAIYAQANQPSHTQTVPAASRYEYGTHSQAIHDAQVAASQRVFPAIIVPGTNLLSVAREFVGSQREELPIDAAQASFIISNTAVQPTVSRQNPLVGFWINTFPQEPNPIFQGYSDVYSFPPPTFVPPPGTIVVPNVVGLYFYDAQLAILGAGFLIAPPILVDQPEGVTLGIVIGQSIAAGTRFLAQDQVQIFITVAAYISPKPPLTP